MSQIQVTYVQDDGSEQVVFAAEGTTLMHAALQNDVPNIIGMCGGTASCGTCHCQLSDDDYAALPPPSDMESEMIDCLDASAPTSRLGCQVALGPALSGIRVRVPASE